MAKRIITISREFGSGGRFIGEEVAKQLGIAYYSENIIDQIAQQSGLSPEYIEENAELSPNHNARFFFCDFQDYLSLCLIQHIIHGFSSDITARKCIGKESLFRR